ncbi:hypothetical protein B0H14DRAFT_31188 [Mycena olivaceomarginata]|nr:hypothetical protein B0H14DRAFT_31188 [Mycena olivaceomarginata]
MLLACYAVLGWPLFRGWFFRVEPYHRRHKPHSAIQPHRTQWRLGNMGQLSLGRPSCAGVSCRVAGQNVPVFDFTKLKNGTMTVFWGTITIPFTGHSVYVFFANQDDVNCAISLDGVSVSQYKATGGASGAESQSVLGYQNTTLEDVAHTLTITTNNNAASDDSVIDFDAIIYSTGGTVSAVPSSGSSTQAAASSSSTGGTTGGSLPTAAPALTPARHTKSPVGPAVGGVIGGLLFLAVLLFLIHRAIQLRKRAAAAAANTTFVPISPITPFVLPVVEPTYPSDKTPFPPPHSELTTSDVGVTTTSPTYTSPTAAADTDPTVESQHLASRLDFIEARFRQLEQLALSSNPNSNSNSSSTAHPNPNGGEEATSPRPPSYSA